jgi:hypothetical protein
VKIYGEGIQEEIYIPLSDIQNNDTFNYINNKDFDMLNSWGTEYHRSYSGIALDDVLIKAGLTGLYDERLQFEADDGFKSFELPVRIVLSNPGMVLLAHKEENQLLEPKELGGDGPVKSVVSLEAIQNDTEVQAIFKSNGQNFVYNSVFAVKYCKWIKIIPGSLVASIPGYHTIIIIGCTIGIIAFLSIRMKKINSNLSLDEKNGRV